MCISSQESSCLSQAELEVSGERSWQHRSLRVVKQKQGCQKSKHRYINIYQLANLLFYMYYFQFINFVMVLYVNSLLFLFWDCIIDT